MSKLLCILSLISILFIGWILGAKVDQDPQVSSSSGAIAASVVVFIASFAAFWYFSTPIPEVKKEVIRKEIRLLSEREYLDQSRAETENALKELRDHCQSPDDLSKVASKP